MKKLIITTILAIVATTLLPAQNTGKATTNKGNPTQGPNYTDKNKNNVCDYLESNTRPANCNNRNYRCCFRASDSTSTCAVPGRGRGRCRQPATKQ